MRVKELAQIVSEEGSEVIKASSKLSRFGPKSRAPGSTTTNINALRGEIHDLLGVYRMLCAELGVEYHIDDALLKAKEEKVEMFLKIDPHY